MDLLYGLVAGLSEDRLRLLQATCSVVEEDLRDSREEVAPDCEHSHQLLQEAKVALCHDHHLLQRSSKPWQLRQPLPLLKRDFRLLLEDCCYWAVLGFPPKTRAIDSVPHDD